MAVDNSKLLYLLDPAFQIENIAGKPAVGGHIEVFYAGTDVKVITKQNFDGVDNPFKVPLNNDGRAVMLVSPGAKYDIYFYDSFNNLIFSRLNVFAQGEGEGSVSGITQIFHDDTLTGDGSYHDPLGAIEYTGILPIDVNNDLHLISAQTTKLGVQEPLYFVQDDDEMTVIGLSGEMVPEGTMNESAFGYEDGQITSYNGSAFSAGNSYEAGSYIDIDGNTISVTGLQPSGEYVTSGDLDEYTKRTDFNDAISSLNSSKLDVDVYSSQSALFLTALPSDVVHSGDLTAYQEAGNYLSASDSANFLLTSDSGKFYPMNENPAGYINELPSDMATTGFVAGVSADITAMIPTGEYLTKESADTLYQPIGQYQSALEFGYVGSEISSINGSGIYSQGGGVTGDFTLVEGNGIQLTDDPIAQTTTISVSGDYAYNSALSSKLDGSAIKTTMTPFGTEMVTGISGYYISAGYANQASTAFYDENGNLITSHYATTGDLQNVSADITAMIPTALTGDYLDKASADTLYYPLNSNPNNYLTTAYTPEFAYHDTAISSIDNSALYDTSAQARINTLAGRINTLSSDKADTTALTAYQEITGMTAYQPVGDYMTTADSANFYTTANESGYITGIPDTYLQNTDLSTTDGKVTAISGIPLSAGGDVPEGVMVESGLEYNAINEISGYNGSAIAQYGAEKQWLVHDDTLVHVANSAQYALGINLSAVAQLLGVDETVLFFAGNESSGVQSGNLTESIKNFKRIRVAGMDNDGHTDVKYIYPAWTKNADGFSTSGYEVMLYGANPYSQQSTIWEKWTRYSFSALTSFNIVLSYEGSYTANRVNNVTNNHKNSIREVVGIGRISG